MIKSPSITNSMVKKSRKLKSFQRDGKRKTCLFGTDFISKVRVKIPNMRLLVTIVNNMGGMVGIF